MVRRRKIISFVKKGHLKVDLFGVQCSWPDMIFQLYFWRTIFAEFCREFKGLSFEKKSSQNIKMWERYPQNTERVILYAPPVSSNQPPHFLSHQIDCMFFFLSQQLHVWRNSANMHLTTTNKNSFTYEGKIRWLFSLLLYS